MHLRLLYALYRLDPPGAERPARETPTAYFASRAEAEREARRLNERDRTRGSWWRWRWRRAFPRQELSGF